MIRKPIDQISKADLDALVVNDVSESKTLEYKQIFKVDTDGEKKEFLADVSAFANTSGGDLLFGVVEKRETGQPTARPERIDGILVPNADALKTRIEQLVQTGIQPRIPTVEYAFVDGFPTGPVLVIRIHKSWVSPHMVTHGNSSRFFARSNAGTKYQLVVGQIRSAFLATETLTERIRQFRIDRIARVKADETPVKLDMLRRVILHLVPIESFSSSEHIDLIAAQERFWQVQLLGTESPPKRLRFNLDGLLLHSAVASDGSARSYIQCFRNGAIEAVSSLGHNSAFDEAVGALRIGDFEENLAMSMTDYLSVYNALKLEGPFIAMMTLVGFKDAWFAPGTGHDWREWKSKTIDRDDVVLPDVQLENGEKPIMERPRELFDLLWQAAGHERSLSYQTNGQWRNINGR